MKSCSFAARRLLAAGAAILSLTALGCGGAAAGGDDDEGPLKVGVLTSLSGPQAQPGQDVLDGIRLYAAQHPELAGRELELLVEDDATDPQRGVAHARELLNRDRVDLIVGIVNSAVLNAVSAQVLAKRVPLVVAVAGSEDFTKPGDPNAFRSGTSNGQPNRALGWYAYERLGMRRVAVLTMDYVAGEEHAGGFEDVFTALGGEIAAVQKAPLGTPDWAPYISRLPRDVDGVYVFAPGADGVKFWKQAASFGLTDRARLIGSFGSADALVLQAVGDDADGFIAAGGYVDTIDNPANERFLADYQREAGRPASIYAEQAYAGMQAVGNALRASDGELGEAFTRALAEVSFDDAPRGPFRLDENHQTVGTTYIFRVEDGRPRVIDEIEDVDQDWQPQG